MTTPIRRVAASLVMFIAASAALTGCTDGSQSCAQAISDTEDVLREELDWVDATVGGASEMWCDDSTGGPAFLTWSPRKVAEIDKLEVELDARGWVGHDDENYLRVYSLELDGVGTYVLSIDRVGGDYDLAAQFDGS